MKYKFQFLTILAFGFILRSLKSKYILIQLKATENQEATSVQARGWGGCCICPWRPGPPRCKVACCPNAIPIPVGLGDKLEAIGCWKDEHPYRALEDAEELVKQKWPEDSSYKFREKAVEKCYEVARTLGRKNFAVQDGGQCFTEGPWKEKKWRGNHQAYGISDKCENDGKGGPMANQVYGRLDGGVSCNEDGDCPPGKYCINGACSDPNIVPTIPPPDDRPQIKEFGSFRWLVLHYKVVHQLKEINRENNITHFCGWGEERTQWVFVCYETIGRLLDILSFNAIGPFVYVVDPDPTNLSVIPGWKDSLKSCLPDAMEQCDNYVVTCEAYWNSGLINAKHEFREKTGVFAANPSDPKTCPAEWQDI